MRPRVKKLRILLVGAGLALLALVSTVFGMMMAVAQDLPDLEAQEEFQEAENSTLYDIRGRRLATLTGDEARIIVDSSDISRIVKEAVVSVEDRRFYEHEGVDLKGIGRALVEDIRRQRIVQGGSTITQQLVKTATTAQDDRTVLQKLREAALAYNLERKWSKDKILTEYLNQIYFGEGAYGVESAARTYFGHAHPGCGEDGGPQCAAVLRPHEAALLAGIIASPTAYSPRNDPARAEARRNLVLDNMAERGVISAGEAQSGKRQALPDVADIRVGADDSKAPYFTSWMRQQVVDLYGPHKAFNGGLEVRTTLDLELQEQIEEIVSRTLADRGPTASVVVIDNRTGGVRAMHAGTNFERRPFNLATAGHRQPGSAFKPFILVRALEEGRKPTDVFTSERKTFDVPGSKDEKFIVNNYENSYLGTTNLATATTFSDNSVYAELGIDIGTRDVARTANRMGIRSEISTNPAMTLGGLEEGVTPLEMAYAYTTLARGGRLVSGTLASFPGTPVAVHRVEGPDGELVDTADGREGRNRPVTEQVVDADAARQAGSILETVVQRGTGKRAAWGGFAAGKTGTTENNGDAWFVGYTEHITVAVWVGYPDEMKPMETEYYGRPVDGGTFPTEIWREVVLAYEAIQDRFRKDRDDEDESPAAPAPAPGPAPEPDPDADEGERAPRERDQAPRERRPEPDTGGGEPQPPQQQPAPEPAPPPQPQPQPAPAAGAPAAGQ